MTKTTWSDVADEFERRLKRVQKQYEGKRGEWAQRIREKIDVGIAEIRDGEYGNADHVLDILSQDENRDREADKIRQCVVLAWEIDAKHPATVLRCLKKKL